MSSPLPSPCSTDARAAVQRLADQYAAPLYAISLRLCRNPEDAADLVQDVFVIALRKWAQFRGDSDPRAWLFAIAARACRRRHRRRAGQPLHMVSLNEVLPFDEPRIAAISDGSPDSLSLYARRESMERMEQAIALLPDAFRMPLILKDIFGLTIPQVAGILRVKEGTIKARLHRTRLRLRKAILHALPTRDAGPPAYPLQTCLDLIRAKQDALDHGLPFPGDQNVICERCKSFFATLDLTRDLCTELVSGHMPAQLRDRLARRLRHQPAQPGNDA